jgi:hypothetical protein
MAASPGAKGAIGHDFRSDEAMYQLSPRKRGTERLGMTIMKF